MPALMSKSAPPMRVDRPQGAGAQHQAVVLAQSSGELAVAVADRCIHADAGCHRHIQVLDRDALAAGPAGITERANAVPGILAAMHAAHICLQHPFAVVEGLLAVQDALSQLGATLLALAAVAGLAQPQAALQRPAAQAQREGAGVHVWGFSRPQGCQFIGAHEVVLVSGRCGLDDGPQPCLLCLCGAQ